MRRPCGPPPPQAPLIPAPRRLRPRSGRASPPGPQVPPSARRFRPDGPQGSVTGSPPFSAALSAGPEASPGVQAPVAAGARKRRAKTQAACTPGESRGTTRAPAASGAARGTTGRRTRGAGAQRVTPGAPVGRPGAAPAPRAAPGRRARLGGARAATDATSTPRSPQPAAAPREANPLGGPGGNAARARGGAAPCVRTHHVAAALPGRRLPAAAILLAGRPAAG